MVARGDEVPLSDYQEERWRPGQILGSSLGLLGTTLYQPINILNQISPQNIPGAPLYAGFDNGLCAIGNPTALQLATLGLSNVAFNQICNFCRNNRRPNALTLATLGLSQKAFNQLCGRGLDSTNLDRFRLDRIPSSGTPKSQGIFEFLSNLIRPATGSIYNVLQRAYPEHRRNPKASCTRCEKCNRNQDRRYYNCNANAFNNWGCVGRPDRYFDKYCQKTSVKRCYARLSSYCLRQCNACMRLHPYNYNDSTRNDLDVDVIDA